MFPRKLTNGGVSQGLFSFNVPRHVEVVECNAVSCSVSSLVILTCSVEACRCGPDCINRVSQRPRDVPLEIFKTQEKGWGVRTAIDIVRGKVLGMYSG
jgi:histone-lysine N-methyltransferase SUV39H